MAHKDRFGMALYVLANITSILFGALILLGVACLIGQPSSWFGIFCLIGLAYMIVGLVFAEYLKRYIYEPFDCENKNKHILFIVLTIVLDLPLGVLYLVKFLQKNKDA